MPQFELDFCRGLDFWVNGKELSELRICAKRKPASYDEQTRRKLRRRETSHQITISDETKEFNNYIVVVTNLGAEIAAEQILALYIKPYTPSSDCVESPTVPGWCAHWPKSLEASEGFDWAGEFTF